MADIFRQEQDALNANPAVQIRRGEPDLMEEPAKRKRVSRLWTPNLKTLGRLLDPRRLRPGAARHNRGL